MGNYNITSGIINAPLKVVLYGPEGIGKSTFASRFPSPVFIDTEGGTKRLDVRRMPAPTCWAMLMDEVASVSRNDIDCRTLVIDTADWAEQLCIRQVCDKAGVSGIEDFGYGKGYTYLKEAFAQLLDALEEVIRSGRNVVMTAHAQLSKFEQPDEMGQYDRWTMKTSKQVAQMLREWCDMLLFANYKTIVVRDGDGKNAKSKATGGKRVMYTTHHPCWDAKNRAGLPDELSFDYSAIAAVIEEYTAARSLSPSPAPPTIDKMLARAADAGIPIAEQRSASDYDGIPAALCELMRANGVTPDELQKVVGDRGYFPADMPVKDYPADFVKGCLIGAWDKVFKMIENGRDLPF